MPLIPLCFRHMKILIKKATFFLVVPLFIICIIAIVHKIKISSIKIEKSVNTLILGDSHTQTGIDDSVLKNALNISQPSEHFLYSYNVLRLLIDNNPQINKVILGVSFHSFCRSYDQYIQDDDKTKFMYPRYYSILDIDSVKDLGKIPVKQFKGILNRVFEDIVHSSTIHDYSFIGGFYKSDRSNLSQQTISSAIQRHYYTESGSIQKHSTIQVDYLKKIIQLCKTKKIKLILVNTPINKNYLRMIPKEIVQDYHFTMGQFDKEVVFLDYHSIDFTDDCYGDGDHLNSIGAQKFTLIMNEIITQ